MGKERQNKCNGTMVKRRTKQMFKRREKTGFTVSSSAGLSYIMSSCSRSVASFSKTIAHGEGNLVFRRVARGGRWGRSPPPPPKKKKKRRPPKKKREKEKKKRKRT